MTNGKRKELVKEKEMKKEGRAKCRTEEGRSL